ncbi:translation machinery-associated protein 22, partial [Selaginella moellendorffii]
PATLNQRPRWRHVDGICANGAVPVKGKLLGFFAWKIKMLYCGVCSLPPEYCEFGPDFEKCKPWLVENASDLYPELVKEKIAQQLGGMTVSDVGNSSKTQEEEIKRLPGGKIKKKEKLEVLVERVTRNKRKCLTTIKGLDMFGVKLADASKKLGKKFASGASVVKGPTEKEQIDVQGDILLDIVEFITETWQNIPESAIYFIEDGKKVPAC